MSTPELSPDELTELLSGLTPEIPGYRVMRLIGRGGMSFVYLALQESLDRQVAIKVIAPHALKDDISKARFEKEARTIAKLQHPCIVGIHAVGRTDEGLLYYVLPYLSKGHLGLRDLTHDDAAVVDVVRALLWALDYAHAHGVVHRDVKAENVLFDNADRPLLTDFGIAVSRRDGTRMTSDGLAVGSSAHMAPEQARAEQVDGRADLYSLGVLTFEMVCGRLPFENPDMLGLAVMHAVDPVPRLPAGKQHWQAFIDTAMAKRASDRFASAREMMAALERVVDQVKREPAVAPARRPGSWSALLAAVASLERRTLLAAAMVALVVAIALGLFALPAAQVERPRAGGAEPAASVVAAVVHDDETGADALRSQQGQAVLEAVLPAAPAAELAPGEAELAAAAQQIARRRLTQPPGDNAFDSLLAARRAQPDAAALAATGQRWLQAATTYVAAGLAAGDDDAARGLFERATALADALRLRGSDAWRALETVAIDALAGRLQAALARGDAAALRRAKAVATQWRLPPARLEPFWSQPLVRVRLGDALRSGGTPMVLARLPDAGGTGLAVQPHAVTRQDYAAFVAATGHASARCRIRTARMTLKRRSWERPGFAQTGNHPVVCVSAADAAAYAAWLGRRDGHRYRLPQAGEWQALAAADASPGCRGRCSGTLPVASGTLVVGGVRSHAGNAREWSAECRDGCRRRISVGTSWRDAGEAPGRRDADAVAADEGYDDIGFRLVREVEAAELDAR